MTVTFDSKHDDPKDCQLIVAITGSYEYVEQKIKDIHSDIFFDDKPIQGTRLDGYGTLSIKTPIWNGKKY